MDDPIDSMFILRAIIAGMYWGEARSRISGLKVLTNKETKALIESNHASLIREEVLAFLHEIKMITKEGYTSLLLLKL